MRFTTRGSDTGTGPFFGAMPACFSLSIGRNAQS